RTDGRGVVSGRPDRTARLPPDGAGGARGAPARPAGGARLPARARGSRESYGDSAAMNIADCRLRIADCRWPIVDWRLIVDCGLAAAALLAAGCSKPAVEQVETKAAAPV